MAFHFILINSILPLIFTRVSSESTLFLYLLPLNIPLHALFDERACVRARFSCEHFYSLWYLVSEQYYLLRSLVKYKMSQLHMMWMYSIWNRRAKIDHEHSRFFLFFAAAFFVKRNIFVCRMFKKYRHQLEWKHFGRHKKKKQQNVEMCTSFFLERWSKNAGFWSGWLVYARRRWKEK